MEKHPNMYIWLPTFVCLALRSYDNHEAVSKDANAHK